MIPANTLKAGDFFPRASIGAEVRSDMNTWRSFGSIARPIIKTAIVNAVLRGNISAREAEEMIAKHGLRSA